MSFYSDHACGAMNDFEFASACARENAKEAYFEMMAREAEREDGEDETDCL